MGDRTNIADARLERDALLDVLADWWFSTNYCGQKQPFEVRVSESILSTLEEHGYVVLRADPDTNDDRPSDLTDELAGAELWSAALRSNVRNGVTRGYSVESMTELADLLDALHDGFYRVEAERDAERAARERAETDDDPLDRLRSDYAAFTQLEAERDAERAARERAETDARQLREAITSAPGELRNAALSVARDGNVDTVSAERWITWFTHLHAAVAARDFGTGNPTATSEDDQR